jgi:hypothetical protein
MKFHKPNRPFRLVEIKLSLALLPCNVNVIGQCSQVPMVHHTIDVFTRLDGGVF